MFDKYQKGQEAMLMVQLRAAQLDFVVSLPTVESRYDMLLDDGKKIHRAQVKYAGAISSKVDGAVTLDLRKETRGNGKMRTYSPDEIDVVLVYVPQIGKVLWIGPELFAGKQTISFRFQASKNHQKAGVRLAEDFEWKSACSSVARAGGS